MTVHKQNFLWKLAGILIAIIFALALWSVIRGSEQEKPQESSYKPTDYSSSSSQITDRDVRRTMRSFEEGEARVRRVNEAVKRHQSSSW